MLLPANLLMTSIARRHLKMLESYNILTKKIGFIHTMSCVDKKKIIARQSYKSNIIGSTCDYEGDHSVIYWHRASTFRSKSSGRLLLNS